MSPPSAHVAEGDAEDKQSGWGSEMGAEVLNNYTEVKAVTTLL